ncbi:MAG: MFS transporter, partial [Parafilimonas terrae]|nr:MFS transporter [Parafilimonas terrae]
RAIESYDATGLAPAEARRKADEFHDAITRAIHAVGYPAKADLDAINYPMVMLILAALTFLVAMVYAPIAAALVELFPTRIRYTAMSLPYNVGNGWFGGFLPTTAFAIVTTTGDIYSGLWYPVALASLSFVVGALFLPETKDRTLESVRA